VMLRGGLDIATPDINTIAAEKVRRSWHNQRIWNHEWKEIPGLMWKHEKYPHVWTKNTRRESPKPPCKATTQAMPTKRAQSRGGSTNQHRPELHATGPDIVPSQSSTPLSLRLQELGSAGLLPEPDFNTQATLSTKPAVDTQIQQRPPVQSTRTPTTVPKQRGKLCLLWEKFTGSMWRTAWLFKKICLNGNFNAIFLHPKLCGIFYIHIITPAENQWSPEMTKPTKAYHHIVHIPPPISKVLPVLVIAIEPKDKCNNPVLYRHAPQMPDWHTLRSAMVCWQL
jgi:hypothetical protein